METIYIARVAEVKNNFDVLKGALNVKMNLNGRRLEYSGNTIDEYEASLVLGAINLGFSVKKALLLKDDNMQLKLIHIKHFTRKKNLREVRARIIGSEGVTKRVMEEISGCHIIIRENNYVAIIGDSESIEDATTAVTSLIRGTKQANIYRYLERANKRNNK